MATAIAPEMTALQGEIERLQANLDATVKKMRDLRVGQLSNGQDSTLAQVDRMWSEVKRQAQQVGHEIEERPLISTATALGAGIALGLLFGARRG